MPLSPQEKDNISRWQLGRKPFYEVYYLKFNDATQGIAGWLRYTLLSPLARDPEVSIWGIFFDAKHPENHSAIKKTYSLRESRIEKDFFYFSGGPSAIFDRGARGELIEGQKKISWEVKLEGGLALRHYPAPLYFGGFPKTKFLAPFVATKISGDFEVNGKKFILKSVPAQQAHLWGTEQAAQWVWGSCTAFDQDPNFVFEGFSAQTMISGKTMPALTCLFFYWEGEWYRFNSPIAWAKNRSQYDLGRWHFEAESKSHLFVGDFFATPENIVGVHYESPEGSESFCHNTKIADLKIQIMKKNKSGWEQIKTLTASKTAALEIVQPKLDERVRLLIP